VLYYLVPFTLALVILGSREIWLNMKGVRPKLDLEAVRKVTGPVHTVPEHDDAGRAEVP
jgi:hypothetical protein